jgi:D-threo-aldose 1-dehydrogenase
MGVAPRERERLLATALDEGVSHFDVAPFYGSGDAEAALGRFARGRRDQLTIATKVGLASSLGDSRLRPLRAAARVAFRFAPAMKTRLADVGRAVKTDYSPKAMRHSLEASLIQLRTDYVDILHLHDWPSEAALRNDIGAELAALKTEGKVRMAGLASSVADVRTVSSASGSPFGVLQFENSLIHPARDLIRSGGGRWDITHRALADTLSSTKWLFDNRPSLRDAWQRRLGTELSTASLAGFLVAWSRLRNPEGTVLFSTRKTSHLLSLVTAAREAPARRLAVDEFEALMQSVLSVLRHKAKTG